LCDPASPVFIARNPAQKPLLKSLGPVVRTTRVGLARATDWPLRFYLNGSEFVSKRKGSPETHD
jgi:DNA-3-methyladenine glycosylase